MALAEIFDCNIASIATVCSSCCLNLSRWPTVLYLSVDELPLYARHAKVMLSMPVAHCALIKC